MYFLDPAKGQERRHAMRESIGECLSATGSVCRTTGQFLRDQFDRLLHGRPAPAGAYG